MHRGKRLFVLGTGPSLRGADLSRLKEELTFGVNYLGQHSDFTPTYYAVSDTPEVKLRQIRAKLRATRSEKSRYRFMGLNEHVRWRDYDTWVRIPRIAREGEDLCLHHGVMEGLGDTFEHIHPAHDAVAEVPLQLGCWMGFQEIYLLGVDCTAQGHFYDNEPRLLPMAANKKTRRVVEGYVQAARLMKDLGRRLYDCSGGRLSQEGVLEYAPLESVL
tara:strand:+ start:5830 stop:6480 length:651 start_codon:yes stop_codon:yes gene_type:complete